MKKYFINNGTEQQGPFNIEELKSKVINKDTPIWYYGLSEWTTVEHIDELRIILSNVPPPFNQNTSKTITNITSKQDKSKNNLRKWIMWIVIAIVSLIATEATGGLALPIILFFIGLYFAWVKLGGFKIFSILSILLSLLGILAGIAIVLQGVSADSETFAALGLGKMGLVLGSGLIIYSIYFLAYSISVLAAFRKK